MASASTPGISLSREVVQLHAKRLRDRILKGECPYPDAALGASESFLRALDASPGASVEALRKQHEDLRSNAETRRSAFGAAAIVAGLAVGFFSALCTPMPANAVVAAFGAVTSRLCFRLAGRAGDEANRHGDFARHLQAWTGHDSDAPPKVPSWQGPVTAQGLRFLAKDFPQELEGFPYATEVKADHDALLRRLEKEGDRPLEDVKADLLAGSRKPATMARAASFTGRLVANAAWVGGAAALAMGQPWVALGLGVAVVGGFGLRVLADQGRGEGPEALRAARSLHYWQEAMAAVPAVKPQDVIFGTEPAPGKAPGTIETSTEDVLIGGVRVPVKGGPSK